MIEVDMEYKELTELLCRAIKQRTLLKIYYKSDRRSDWRIIKTLYDVAKPKKIYRLQQSIEDCKIFQ